jgi:hypothetical protein
MQTEVKYLKKMGTPDWLYYAATPILLALAQSKKELFPYDPVTKRFIGMNGQQIPEHVEPGLVSPENNPEVRNMHGRVQEGEDAPPDPNKVTVIVSAIPQLKEADWTKATGQRPAMPRVDALSILLGYDVTREERDAAFKEYSEQRITG